MKFGTVIQISPPNQTSYTHTTHSRFTALLEFVRDHPCEQVPER